MAAYACAGSETYPLQATLLLLRFQVASRDEIRFGGKIMPGDRLIRGKPYAQWYNPRVLPPPLDTLSKAGREKLSNSGCPSLHAGRASFLPHFSNRSSRGTSRGTRLFRLLQVRGLKRRSH